MTGRGQVIDFWALARCLLANSILTIPSNRGAVIVLARADGAGNFTMRPRERRETSEQDLFRSRLDQIIDMKHALVKLGRAIDWRFLEERFGAVYTDRPGQPPLPTRLLTGLAVLKHTTFPTRLCAIAGWRTRISSTSAARNFSNMRWC